MPGFLCLWRWLFPPLTLIFLGLQGAPVRADVWGYVDAQGVAHFSIDRLDERYELFFQGNESFFAGNIDKPTVKNGDQASSGRTTQSGDDSRGTTDHAPAPTKLLAYFDMSPSYKAVKHLLKDASVKHGIEYELLQAVIATESGFDTHAVSPKGAVGLMQLIPPTAERYGVRADKNVPIAKKLVDPETNIQAGSRYLSDLINMFPGQLELAIAAYNAGEGAVQRAGNKIPNYPETRNYVKTVLQLYKHLKPPSTAVAERKATGRVRLEMMGGTLGRNNMVPSGMPQSLDQDTFQASKAK